MEYLEVEEKPLIFQELQKRIHCFRPHVLPKPEAISGPFIFFFSPAILLIQFPKSFQEIEEVGKALNIVPTIIRGEELKERGFGGIYGVGNAAVVPPALVILSHLVPNSKDTIAWVGKGIVYDTGGLCIKGRVSINLLFTY